MNRIARFEALAERLVEGTFARLFAGYLHPLEVATHLARAMEDRQAQTADGTALAPTHYWVYLHQQDFEPLLSDRPALAEHLSRYIVELAQNAGLTMLGKPAVSVEPCPRVPLHAVRVEARWESEEERSGNTREMTGEEQSAIQAAAEEKPEGQPFLIVDGQRHVDLVEPVISIGRALDNDLILEDTRVSRHHAQLRRRYGRYILYDLGSSSGTTINDYPVQECVLQSGDVISFAGVEVIYGEDPLTSPPQPEKGDTPALSMDDRSGSEETD